MTLDRMLRDLADRERWPPAPARETLPFGAEDWASVKIQADELLRLLRRPIDWTAVGSGDADDDDG